MKNVSAIVVMALLTTVTLTADREVQLSGSVAAANRLYVLDCGVGHAADQSRWSAGVNKGKPIDISVSCYLIRHGRDYFLWDTGISDHVAAMPQGWLRGTNPAVDILWRRGRTLAAQLADVHVAPSEITYVGLSHAHPDHIGNAELFPGSTILMQKAEADAYFKDGPEGGASIMPPGDPTPALSKSHPMELVEEDLDVFGDGSVMIVWTPGHTVGHQSCLVHLPKTGWILLSGDAVHLKTNWDNRRVPYFARLSMEAKMQTALSMQRMADLVAFYHAQLWIVHDKVQSDRLKHAPAYYE
jgi:N-acyl homoserine lactone hydrolase